MGTQPAHPSPRTRVTTPLPRTCPLTGFSDALSCSRKFKRACRKLGIVQSMGGVASCFDNAVSEAFNSVLKVEYVHRHTFRTRTEARIETAIWITDFYNTRRLHSVCGLESPIGYEREYRATLTEGLAAWIVSTLRGD
jgi:transposase InsO family protein